MSAGLDYSPWTELLAAIVTPGGKVDYEVLAPRRDLLTRFVASLEAASPDSAPDRFPRRGRAGLLDHAYNAFGCTR